MKRYRLLKDLPDAKTGDIFQRKTDDAMLVDIIYKIDSEEIALAPTYHIEDITNFDDWFEEIKKPVGSIHWKPKIGDIYWAIGSDGTVLHSKWDNDNIDNGRYEIGNCYRTEEDTKHAKKIQIARTKIKRSSDFKPDWNNKNQFKYYIAYDYVNNCLYIRASCYIDSGVIVYYETKEDSELAIENLEPEYLLHFNVNKRP